MKHNTKRLLSALLVLLLLVSLAPAAFAASGEGEKKDAEAEEKPVVHIRTAEDLLELASNCSLDTWSAGRRVELDNDLSVAGVDFTSIPFFNGTFDGRGHTIYDLSLSGAQSPCGFFLETGPDASIRALNISGTVAPRGEDSMVGGVVGLNRGALTACGFTGAVSAKSQVGGVVGCNEASGLVTACTVSGSVMGLSSTGGICGYNAGALAACTSYAYVNTESVDPALHLSDIDTSSLVNFFKSITTDTAGVTTDTGGVAGSNIGFVERCTNYGPVGYLHLGYNVGGVVGRSSGFVDDCLNTGDVHGRRDVGGVVGQAEPLVELEEVENLLAGLSHRVDALHESINNAIVDANMYSSALAEQLSTLPAYLNPVAEALRGGNLRDDDTRESLAEIIAGSLSEMSGTLTTMAGDMGGSSSVMSAHFNEINDDITALSDTSLQALALLSGDEESQILADDSEQDEETAVIFGKVKDSTNEGAVNGDNNVGGVAGSISIENELDPDGNLDLSKARLTRNRLSMRAVIRHCVSRGAVSAKRECAGGVVGRMDLGFVTNSAGYGSIALEEGDYAGGICGLCYGNIRSSVAKCSLSGNRYIGGVVGNGYNAKKNDERSSLVAGCYSLVEIRGEPQFAGAISGGSEGVYEENYFVPAGFAGMDKLSVHGQAEPINFAAFAALEGIPEECKHFMLSFVVEGETVKALPFEYGDSFDRSVFPRIERRDGAYAVWDRMDLTNLRFDTVVTAEYRMDETVLRSELTRDDGRAAVFVDGQFQSGDALTLELLQIGEDELDAFRGDWRQTVREHFDSIFRAHEPDWSVPVGVAEKLRVSFPDDGAALHTLRYLTPDGTTRNHRLYLIGPDGPVRVHPDSFGSYYLLKVAGTQAELTLVNTIQSWWIAAYIAGGLMVLGLLALLIVRLVRFIRKRRLQQRTPPDWVLAVRGFCAAHRKKLLLGGAGVLLSVAAVLGILRYSSISAAIETYRVLSEFAEQESAIQTDIAVHSSARELTLSDSIVRVRKNDKLISCTDQFGIPLYFSGNAVYLPNGRAFVLSDARLDRSAVLELAREIFRKGEIQRTRTDGETRYEAVLDSVTADDVLKLILTGDAAGLLKAESMTVAMTARGTQLTGLFFTGGGVTESGKSFTVEASLIPGPVVQRPVIPQDVLDAVELGGKAAREILSEDLVMLLAAWMKYDSAETAAAKIAAHTDAGLLRLDSSYDYQRARVQGKEVHRLGGRLFTLYFTEDAACTSNGNALSLTQEQVLDTARLIPLAKEICLKGDFDCTHVGQRRIYTVSLNKDTASELAVQLVPELKTVKLDLSSCELAVTVSDSELMNIDFNCIGTVRVVSRDVDSSVNVTVSFTDPPAALTLPAAVRRTLLGG